MKISLLSATLGIALLATTLSPIAPVTAADPEADPAAVTATTGDDATQSQPGLPGDQADAAADTTTDPAEDTTPDTAEDGQATPSDEADPSPTPDAPAATDEPADPTTGESAADTADTAEPIDPGNAILPGETTAGSDLELELMAASADTRAWSSSAGTVTRYGGPTRYWTSFMVAEDHYKAGTPVFLTTGQNWPDALAASPAAAKVGGMVMLVEPRGDNQGIVNLLRQRKPSRIYILGGSGVVPQRVYNQFKGIAPMERLAGRDRYTTSLIIAQRFFTPVNRAYIATGRNFPDALAGAVIAGRWNEPIVLVDGQARGLGAATVNTLRGMKVKATSLLGGRVAINQPVRNAFRSLKFNPDREWAGVDRYQTAELLSTQMFDRARGTSQVGATRWQDAVSIASVASQRGWPMLLSRPDCVSWQTKNEIVRLKASGPQVIVGGVDVVTPAAGSLAVCRTSGATPGAFRNDLIVHDSMMFNHQMSEADIQRFLESRDPWCRPGSVPCIKDWWFDIKPFRAQNGTAYPQSGGKQKASRIIWESQQSSGVSAMALLVILQKEQSLITGSGGQNSWNRYNKAMGFACPDTAPCAGQYADFQFQVFGAAHRIMDYGRQTGFNHYVGKTSWVGESPEANCGGSWITMQNRATAALYNYTPYQPNRAKLAAGYGKVGDRCSSNGNYNFWYLMRTWFG